MKIGFDNDKYLQLQAEHITARRAQFGGKLYLEFGGKLFDDYHASRVLPGFQPDSKIRMLRTLKDDVEIVVAICAGDIEKTKKRAARTGLNPRTKETVEIPASKVPAFKAGKALKDAVAE